MSKEFDEEVQTWGSQYSTRKTAQAWGILPGYAARRIKRRKSLCLHLLDPKEGQKILDLGCGGGYFAQGIISKKANWIGLDISFNMLADGKKRFTENNIKAVLINAAADKIPFQKKTFDAIIAVGLINYFPIAIVNDIFSEINRIVKPTGTFIFTNLRLDIITWLRSRLPRFIPHPIRLPGPIIPHGREKIESLLNQTGFKIDEVKKVKKLAILPFYMMIKSQKILEKKG